MQLLWTILVTFFAGMGAGLGTGFAGMSAAAVISPMLITFLHMDPYMAVGIALSSDVLASAVSAYTYHKNKNLDVRNGLIMMGSVLTFTVVGSYVASLLPSAPMGGFSVFMTFLRPSFLRSYVGIRRPHLVLGECCVCGWRGFWILRFWEMPLFSNIAFFETCDFRKSALRLYEG